MDPLIYSAEVLGYILGPSLRDKKLALINDINTIQLALKKGPLTPTQFEQFLSCELSFLQTIVNDQSSLLHKY